MIVLNKEMSFISLYLAEKEYFITDDLRKALSDIYYLIHTKKKSKALSIYLTNEKYKKKINPASQQYYNFTTKYLWKIYNSRLAHIKNAKDKFEIWDLDIRLIHYGMKKKLCKCGCGQEVIKFKNSFINGHNAKCRSKEENIEMASYMRSFRELKKSTTVISLLDRSIRMVNNS